MADENKKPNAWRKLKTAVDEFVADEGEYFQSGRGMASTDQLERFRAGKQTLMLLALVEIAGSLDSLAAIARDARSKERGAV